MHNSFLPSFLQLTLIHHIAIYVLFYSICASGDDCGVRDNPDVNYFDVQLPEINVPNHLTSYVCQQFKVSILVSWDKSAILLELEIYLQTLHSSQLWPQSEGHVSFLNVTSNWFHRLLGRGYLHIQLSRPNEIKNMLHLTLA